MLCLYRMHCVTHIMGNIKLGFKQRVEQVQLPHGLRTNLYVQCLFRVHISFVFHYVSQKFVHTVDN